MKKLLHVVFLLIPLFGLVGCDNDSTLSNSGVGTSERRDSLYYVTEDIGDLAMLARTNSGILLGVMDDENGRTAYLNSERLPQDSSLVMRLDSLDRVCMVYYKNTYIGITYHDVDEKVDVEIIREDGETNSIKNVDSPYKYSTIDIVGEEGTRAGRVLTPTSVVTGVLGVALAWNKWGGVLDRTTNGVGLGASFFDGWFADALEVGANAAGVAAAGIVVAGATTISAPVVIAGGAIVVGGIALANKAISMLQNGTANGVLGKAQPVTLDWKQTGDNQITVWVRVDNVSPSKSEFYVGAMLADGLYITKAHNLGAPKQTYSGNGVYTFVFDKLWKNQTYKVRAFIEPSGDLFMKDQLDYNYYGNVINGIKLRDYVATVNSASQSYSDVNDTGSQYTFGIKGNATLDLTGYSSWGVALETETYIAERVFLSSVSQTSFEFETKVARTFMEDTKDGKKPISHYRIVPFVESDGKRWYMTRSAKDVDLVYKESLLCPDNNHPHMIDLGLPSGTKWACCNVGASAPEDYGHYFAWGETSPKSYYEWSTYKWCRGSYDTMTKYCTSSSRGTVDNKTELDLADDAAHANWGGSWRMPSKAQRDELRHPGNCTWTWTTLNGKNGYRVTSKVNGNSIFLPAAGYRIDSSLYGAGSNGCYWSSSLVTSYPDGAYRFDFSSDRGYSYYYVRCCGRSVRPVCL